MQQASYVDGQVCTSGATTSPLAAWDFGDNGLDFLLTPVTSDGLTDSALLPEQGSPGRVTTPITTGEYGLASQTDIDTYAALISIFGSRPDPDAALTAKAILDAAGTGPVPSCVSAAAAQALVGQARRLAGPYTVTATAATSPAAAGAADALTVHVASSSNQPVPDTAVVLTSPVPIFANGTSSLTVHTDAAGSARVPFTVPQDNTISSVSITATASVSVGLEAVTANGAGGHQYASAVFADPPTPFTANTTVAVNQGASPVLTSRLSSTAVSVGAQVPLSQQLTGMFGHAGEVTFSILGPLKFDAAKMCAGFSPQSFAGTPVAAKSTLNVIGDSQLTGGNWQPTTVGCYLLQSQVVTSNATPQATARGPQLVLTVLDTTAAATPQHTVVGVHTPLTETVQLAHTYHRPGNIATNVLGPLTPGNGDCQNADWSKAKVAASAPTKTTGDGSYTISTPALAATGCYELQSALELAVDSRTTAHIPLTAPPSSSVFYVLAPTVIAAADATSVVSPATVRTSVTVLNSYGQPGHISIQMLQVPADEFGCRRANFAGAAMVGSGAAVPIKGDGEVTAVSGATAALGCYALVPKLVMDNNPAVTVTGTPNSDNAVLAGVGLAPPTPRARATVGHSLLGTYLTFGIFLLILMLTAFGVFRYVTVAGANEEDDAARPSPSGSWLGSMFTTSTSTSN